MIELIVPVLLVDRRCLVDLVLHSGLAFLGIQVCLHFHFYHWVRGFRVLRYRQVDLVDPVRLLDTGCMVRARLVHRSLVDGRGIQEIQASLDGLGLHFFLGDHRGLQLLVGNIRRIRTDASHESNC